ncbi:DUF5343 domain-containing protein [Devosia aurantiaca]|uniref:DUF5343 domain-containing protein n=1 Tax=Devosia aurantiaca TaxID=2714858 RepID=A0A6M1SJ30_9HYPH|nr:DUF5343 domain-containing protein [Devosia aurantiaca]NGP17110.1 DUF5343 domain-containing protein [Devosia aurantiaca]
MTAAAENPQTTDEGKRETSTEQAASPRKIPGNLPYISTPGTLKRVLEKLVEAQRPDKFTADFLANVLKMSGGGARSTIPMLKKMGFLSSEGVPTDLYGKFRTEAGQGAAALQGLRSAYAEIFKRSDYAHAADEAKIKDIIVEITGLKSNDAVAGLIRSTFNAIKSFVPQDIDVAKSTAGPDEREVPDRAPPPTPELDRLDTAPLRLAYNINIVLPETSDLNVLNAIFKSIKENLMR